MEITKQNINLLLILTSSIWAKKLRQPRLGDPSRMPLWDALSVSTLQGWVWGAGDWRATLGPHSLLYCGGGRKGAFRHQRKRASLWDLQWAWSHAQSSCTCHSHWMHQGRREGQEQADRPTGRQKASVDGDSYFFSFLVCFSEVVRECFLCKKTIPH